MKSAMSASSFLDDEAPSASDFLDLDDTPSTKDKVYKSANKVFKQTSVMDGKSGALPSNNTGFKQIPLNQTLLDNSIENRPVLNEGSKIVDGLGGIAEIGARKGYAGIGRISAGAIKLLSDVLGSDTLSNTAKAQQDYANQVENGAVLRGTPVEGFAKESIVQDLPNAATNAIGSVITTAPSLAAGTIAPGAVLPSIFATTGAQEYGQGREAGLNPAGAAIRAIPQAAFEVAGEKLGGMDKFAEALQAAARGNGVADLGAAMLASSIKELPSEEFTTAGQFLTDKAPGIGLNQEATLEDFGQQAKDTALATILQSAAMGAGGNVLSKVKPQTIQGEYTTETTPVEQPATTQGDAMVEALNKAQEQVAPKQQLTISNGTEETAAIDDAVAAQKQAEFDASQNLPSASDFLDEVKSEPANNTSAMVSEPITTELNDAEGSLGLVPDTGTQFADAATLGNADAENIDVSPTGTNATENVAVTKPKKKASKSPSTLLGTLKGLGGVTMGDKLDVTGQDKAFAPGGYNQVFTNKSKQSLKGHIENGDLDAYLPYDMRTSNITQNSDAYDSTPAYDYLAERIRNGERVLPYETIEEIQQNKFYANDDVQNDINLVSEYDDDQINAFLREAGYDERESISEAQDFEQGQPDSNIVSGERSQTGTTGQPTQAQNEVIGTPRSERQEVKPIVEAIVKRRAAATQLGKSKQFDTALQAAKDFMAGEQVNPNKLKNAATLFKNDKVLADNFTQLHELAKAPAKESRAEKTNAIESYKQKISEAKTKDDLQAIAGQIQNNQALNDNQVTELDDLVMEALDKFDEADNGKTQSLKRDSSWVIRNKETGEVIKETFQKSVADKVNTDKYEAVPVMQHLQELNQEGSKARNNAEDKSNQSNTDLLGEDTTKQQELADAERAKDAKRNTGNSDTEGFTLTGSDSEADKAAANGAQSLFSRQQVKTESFNEWAGYAPLVSKEEAQTYEFKSGKKIVVEAYHGTQRPDRVGTIFNSKRATSAAMAYFTSSPELASSYAQGKQDTSLSYEDTDYNNWFKYKPESSRSKVSIDRAWYFLPQEVKSTISERMKDIRMDDDGKVIYEKDGGDLGNYDWELQQTQRGSYDRRGNPLKAAVETWLNSGALYNVEEEFLEVLKLAGFPMKEVEMDSPNSSFPFVYKTYVKMLKPLVTSDIPQEVVDALNMAAKKDKSRAKKNNADMWDKSNRTLKEWVENFNEEDNQYVWTSIPDKVTDVFKSLGYDGIVDWSNKGGAGQWTAPVYVPFRETQVKSAIGNKGKFNPDKKDILLSNSDTFSSLTKAEVEKAVSKELYGLDVDVFESMNDAPIYIRVQAKSEGASGVEGYFDARTNKVALIANNLSSAKRAIEVARHELIGHYGMENMLGKDLMGRLINRVLEAEKSGNKTIIDVAKQVDETQPNIGDKRRAKEIIAVMGERNYQNSIVRQVLDAIRTFLNKLGVIKSDITDAQVSELLRTAQLYLRKQNRSFVEASATSFSAKPNTDTKKSNGNFLFRRDELGRIQLTATAKAYDVISDITQNIADKANFGMATPELRKLIRKFKADMSKALDTASEVAQKMSPLTEADRKLVSDVVENMVKTGVTPPDHIVKVALGMQQTMDAQTDELVKLGMLSKDSAERWRGKYLPRFYNREQDPALNTLAKKLFKAALPVRGMGGGSLKGRGLYEEINVNELSQWEQLGWEVRDPLWKKNQTGKLELIDPNKVRDTEKVMVWRDFTPSERESMGENRDALFRFLMGYTAMQNDIALGRMFDSIAKNQEWTRSRPSEGYTKIPDSEISDTGGVKKYGNLAGLYVRDDIIQHITQYEESGELLKFYRKALSFWKMGKTVLNPVSHMNNVVSNLTMAHFAGVSYWDSHKYIGALRDFVKNAPMIQEAKDAGLMTGDISRAELIADMPDDIKAMMDQQDSKITKSARTTYNILTFGLTKPMSNAYRFEDDFFKYLIYKDARKNGVEPDDAVDYATKYIFNYDDLPLNARRVRDFAIPFFAYTYKAVPALAHTAFNYPWRFAAPALAIGGINAIAYALAAGDDDDDLSEMFEKGKELEAEERKNLPPWMQGNSALGTEKTIRLGKDKKTGYPVFMDVSRMIPGGDVFDVTNQMDGVSFAPIMPSNPILTTMYAMFANKDSFTGKDVTDKNDTDLEKAKKRSEWLIKQVSPQIAPTGYHADRLAQAGAYMADTTIETPFKDYTGYGKDGLPVQGKYAIPQTFGVKIRPVDLELSEDINKGKDMKEMGSIKGEIRQAKRLLDKGAMSQREYDRQLEAAKEKIQAIRNKQ